MQDVSWPSVIAVFISLLALVVSGLAEWRARRAEVRFEIELDERNPGRIIVRNTGSKTVRRTRIDPTSLSQVRYTSSHNKPKDLIAGDKLEVWADEADHSFIPNTLRIRFGRFGVRAVKVPGEGRPAS